MAKKSAPSQTSSLTLASEFSAEVLGWRQQGYHPLSSETTRQLLSHCFPPDDEADAKFHDCQRFVIETIFYLHEIRRQFKNGSGDYASDRRTSVTEKLDVGRKYTIAARVVDVFGNDAAGTAAVEA